jgi:hypothetical protein
VAMCDFIGGSCTANCSIYSCSPGACSGGG